MYWLSSDKHINILYINYSSYAIIESLEINKHQIHFDCIVHKHINTVLSLIIIYTAQIYHIELSFTLTFHFITSLHSMHIFRCLLLISLTSRGNAHETLIGGTFERGVFYTAPYLGSALNTQKRHI